MISPALGGLFVGHEVGRALDKRHIFVEKEDGKLVLRRFKIGAGERFIVVEDVVTRGGRVQETVDIVRRRRRRWWPRWRPSWIAAAAKHPDYGCPFRQSVGVGVETLPGGCLAGRPGKDPGGQTRQQMSH